MSNTPNSWEDAAGDDDQLARQTSEQLNVQSQPYRPPHQQQRGSFRPSFNAPAFNPGAASFQPTAPVFTPGAPYQQYGQQPYYGGAPYQHVYPQYGQNQYQQYQQQQYQPPHQQQYRQYQSPQHQHQQHQHQQHQHQQQQQQQQQQPQQPVIAKRPPQGPSGGAPQAQNQARPPPSAPSGPKASANATVAPASTSTITPGAPKVLKIGGAASTTPSPSQTPAPVKKDEKLTGAAVLTIGGGEKKAPAVLNISGAASGTASGTSTPKESNKPAPTDKVDAGAKVSAAKAVSASNTPSGKSSPAPATPDKAADKRDADLVSKEQEEVVDDATIEELYGKEHVNLIFIGHVDAGKSSLGGSILFATGMVDDRTMEKYKQEAKAQGRESWYLSWALDLTKEERAKGKTVEVGKAYFETEKRRYTILDAPGHKNFVPSMIGGASQADVGILVISARKGEYETGFEKGGQTREHAVLAKTQGVSKLIVVVNKMDDSTVEWSKERYDECITKLTQFLRSTGYNAKTDLMFMPISALTGIGLKDRIPKSVCPWYDGPSLLEYLDNMKTLERKLKAPFMMPISAKYKDMGTVIEGKIEQDPIEVLAIYSETEDEIPGATCGDQVRLRVKGVEEEDVVPGFVLTSRKNPVNCVTTFEAQIHIIDLKSILTAGFQCVMHVHTTIQEVTFVALLHKLEKGTGRKSKKPPPFASKGQAIIARLEAASSFALERYEDYQQLGRFTLRDQGQTIAIGKVTKLIMDPAGTA
ncbi:P-loop containing nucleoside triphosphate hydrolase protein [Kalaharituber pfeilii]|nr:P-loop containing nucleoside triphosphate hydrolase protein [Kalaharituber pfeilii]